MFPSRVRLEKLRAETYNHTLSKLRPQVKAVLVLDTACIDSTSVYNSEVCEALDGQQRIVVAATTYRSCNHRQHQKNWKEKIARAIWKQKNGKEPDKVEVLNSHTAPQLRCLMRSSIKCGKRKPFLMMVERKFQKMETANGYNFRGIVIYRMILSTL